MSYLNKMVGFFVVLVFSICNYSALSGMSPLDLSTRNMQQADKHYLFSPKYECMAIPKLPPSIANQGSITTDPLNTVFNGTLESAKLQYEQDLIALLKTPEDVLLLEQQPVEPLQGPSISQLTQEVRNEDGFNR
ncbi:MAG: hypothetical protein K6C34_02915 [Alphaproteobacteria bacterium]|nr:hypothetical protein [Alphaproteobacteria bacterium]